MMNLNDSDDVLNSGLEEFLNSGDAFSRQDESDDLRFYSVDRFVEHLDSVALDTVEKLIDTLVIERKPAILDLMAGWDSHIPKTIEADEVVGLGLNENELCKNHSLTEFVIHDINKDPVLPFEDDRFDVVLNTVSVDYMTKPFEVFREVARILKPGGLFLVIFSNRMFLEKVVKIWRESSEPERVMLVEDFFRGCESFDEPSTFRSKGKPRPKDDRYADRGIPSDPIYAVYAEKKAADPKRGNRPSMTHEERRRLTADEMKAQREEVKRTLCCPSCGHRMKKWLIPDSPFNIWNNEYMYICFNDECPYLVRGWDVMSSQGNAAMSYRQMFNPETGSLTPMPVPNLKALKDGIVEEDG
jgi:SAM-dependent methyltransferase